MGTSMKYLCLVYMEPQRLHAVPDSECAACGAGMRSRGVLIAAEALQPVDTATTVRVRNGRVSVTDGPFAETKEQLAGFYLIEAKDLNEAIQTAAMIPPAREGSVEVRPVRELNPKISHCSHHSRSVTSSTRVARRITSTSPRAELIASSLVPPLQIIASSAASSANCA